MLKQIAAASIILLATTGCVSPSNSEPLKVQTIVNVKKQNNPTLFQMIEINRIDSIISKLKNTVGRTWYVFSGNTPSGWDCSGLTMWFYQQLGITLEHRASIQSKTGFRVKTPRIGDIVAFSYKGYSSAYHVGIYIGNGMMIHAPEKGQVTRIESINNFAGKYSNIQYRRIKINSIIG